MMARASCFHASSIAYTEFEICRPFYSETNPAGH